jgi:hypothetical protein
MTVITVDHARPPVGPTDGPTPTADAPPDDPWCARIAAWLASSNRVQGTKLMAKDTERFTKHQLLGEALGLPVRQMDPARARLMAVRVGAVMQRLGWSYDRDPENPSAWHFRRPA